MKNKQSLHSGGQTLQNQFNCLCCLLPFALLMNFNTFLTINLTVAMFPQYFATAPPFPSMMMILWDTIDACMFWSKFLA